MKVWAANDTGRRGFRTYVVALSVPAAVAAALLLALYFAAPTTTSQPEGQEAKPAMAAIGQAEVPAASASAPAPTPPATATPPMARPPVRSEGNITSIPTRDEMREKAQLQRMAHGQRVHLMSTTDPTPP
jgi:hypothetical protein